jgi:hypothetical protein
MSRDMLSALRYGSERIQIEPTSGRSGFPVIMVEWAAAGMTSRSPISLLLVSHRISDMTARSFSKEKKKKKKKKKSGQVAYEA